MQPLRSCSRPPLHCSGGTGSLALPATSTAAVDHSGRPKAPNGSSLPRFALVAAALSLGASDAVQAATLCAPPQSPHYSLLTALSAGRNTPPHTPPLPIAYLLACALHCPTTQWPHRHPLPLHRSRAFFRRFPAVGRRLPKLRLRASPPLPSPPTHRVELPPAAPHFPRVSSMLLLFETPAGYALFKAQSDIKGVDADDLWKHFTSPEKAAEASAPIALRSAASTCHTYPPGLQR